MQVNERTAKKFNLSLEDFQKRMAATTTLYVGNLSFFTTEEQIWELFSKCGELKRIIMGLNRQTKIPCGFCFVEYYQRESAECCEKWLNQTKLDDRVIRVALDPGWSEGINYFSIYLIMY
eukprot:TRINITY_DN2487_c0_g2_i1.p1 TRINITY_DN2487_c0_g2~~TRINITY_DN2487_c0_g2_i1.p1  ORF type:complete len:120 (+),score=15.04 TRINITY_DN2487_c0_g2_i1:41-400(+)